MCGKFEIAATNIEDVLEMQITSKLPALAEDEPARKKIFEHNGLISSFSKRIEMAYAMGIIDKAYRKKIDLIREIRNACAHARFPLSMEKQVLRDACKALLAATWNDLIEYQVVQTASPTGWKWTVHLDDGQTKTGMSSTEQYAIFDATNAIEKALSAPPKAK